MSSSSLDREDSPDWLRSFQPPAPCSITTVSSDSGASADKKRPNVAHYLPAKRIKTHKHIDESLTTTSEHHNHHSVWALSSDSDSHSNAAFAEQPIQDSSKLPTKAKQLQPNHNNKTNPKLITKTISPNNNPQEPFKIHGELSDAVEDRLPEKHIESRVSSSTLSLLLPDKVSRSKALVECEGESIDLSGDMGAVGRVIIPENPSGEHELFLDLKGTIYKTAIVPSRTFCVVSIGPSEAKIEAIMNDFIQLKAQSNVYDAETMVEGTLEGFSFDSEDEADRMTKDIKTDQNEEAEEQSGKKTGGKVEKKLGATQKKGKATAGKQPKKRKPQATKKSKGKK